MITSSPSVDPADEQAIRQIVADIEEGFNTNQPHLLVRHMAADALIVNPFGVVMHGPEEVKASVAALLEGGPLQEATAHYRLTDITLLAPDVIVAHKNAWSSQQMADAGEPPEMNSLYVLVKRDGAWEIVRRQNTAIGP